MENMILKINVHLSGKLLDELGNTIHEKVPIRDKTKEIFRRISRVFMNPIIPAGMSKKISNKNNTMSYSGAKT